MISRTRRPAPAIHLPLLRLALCLDCEECFEIGFDCCPACGSESWSALARFLGGHPENAPAAGRRDRSSRALERMTGLGEQAGTRHLLIVARNRQALFEQLKAAFADNERIQVLVDRRTGERRQRKDVVSAAERRRADRRNRHIDEQLRTIGWALVLMDDVRRR